MVIAIFKYTVALRTVKVSFQKY